ncbi:hypothetical protein ABTX87_61005, partial [Streptomyces sp. NPDC097610]
MPEAWENDRAYMQDQRALALIQRNYSTGVPFINTPVAGRNWGQGWDGSARTDAARELHDPIINAYRNEIRARLGNTKSKNPVFILMAGAGGIGKTTALDNYLESLNSPKSDQAQELGRLTNVVPGATPGDSFISLSHQSIKDALCINGGVDHIPKDWWRNLGENLPTNHSYRNEARYDLKSAAIHMESSFVMNKIAKLCIEERASVAYDIGVTNGPNVEPLLAQAKNQGYTVVAISVEGSHKEALAGNYEKSKKGLIVSPLMLIDKSYNNPNESICRQNVAELHRKGYVDSILTVDRGPVRISPVNPVARYASVDQQNSTPSSAPPPYSRFPPAAVQNTSFSFPQENPATNARYGIPEQPQHQANIRGGFRPMAGAGYGPPPSTGPIPQSQPGRTARGVSTSVRNTAFTFQPENPTNTPYGTPQQPQPPANTRRGFTPMMSGYRHPTSTGLIPQPQSQPGLTAQGVSTSVRNTAFTFQPENPTNTPYGTPQQPQPP